MSMEALAWRMEILLRRQQGDEVLERRREKWQISSATQVQRPAYRPQGELELLQWHFGDRMCSSHVKHMCMYLRAALARACTCTAKLCHWVRHCTMLQGSGPPPALSICYCFMYPSLFRNVMATNELQEPPHRCASQSRRRCLNNLD